MDVMVFVSARCSHCPAAWRNARLASKELPETRFEKIRIKTSEGRQLSRQYKIMSVPTFVFKEGDNIQKITGAISVDEIKQIIAGDKKKGFLSGIFK